MKRDWRDLLAISLSFGAVAAAGLALAAPNLAGPRIPLRPIGSAVIAVQGDGYPDMAWNKEGLNVAAVFAAHGVTAFSLAYCLPYEGWPGGGDDPLVGPEHSLALRKALRLKRLDVETHLFAQGGHGFSLRMHDNFSVKDWPGHLLVFGRKTGWIR